MKKSSRIVLKTVCAIAGVWFGLLLLIQIVVSPAVLTGVINKYAAKYVDANISFSRAGLSVFRAFPNVGVILDSCVITYPSERYEEIIKNPGTLKMARLGTAAGYMGYELDSIPSGGQDTLAVFDRFDATVNPFALIFNKVKIPKLIMEKPRMFLHSYDSLHANWNIFGESTDSEEADSTDSSFSLPGIVLGKVQFTHHPHIVYSSSQDTISAIVDMKQLSLMGMIDDRLKVTRPVHIQLDSLIAAGRVSADTVIAGIDYMKIDGHRGGTFDTDMNATAYWGSGSFGRLRIPVSVKGKIKVVEDSVITLDIPHLHASVAHIPFVLSDSRVSSHSDSLYLKLNMKADGVSIDTLLHNYGRQIIAEEATKLHTDAVLNVDAAMDGWYVYDPVKYPALTGTIEIPDSKISYEGIEQDAKLSVSGKISTDEMMRYNLDFNKISVSALDSTYLRLKLGIDDLLGDDPLIHLNASLKTDLDSIAAILPPEMGISADGNMQGKLGGDIYLSQLDTRYFSQADINGCFKADRIFIKDTADTLDVNIKNIDIDIASSGNKDNEDMKRGERVLSLSATIDSLSARYCNAFDVTLDKFALSAQNSAGIVSEGAEGKYYPFLGTLSIGKMNIADSDSTVIKLRNSSNSFRISPKKKNPEIPVLKLSSSNGRISMRDKSGLVSMKGVDLNATAAMNTIERNAKRKALLDSLATVYPDTPRDSLFKRAFRDKMPKEMPSWLSEKDFEKSDINLKLDESMAKYFREWDLNASVGIKSGRISTPYFPLRTGIEDAKMTVTNNQIALKSLCMTAGESDVDMSGEINGLKRALLGRGPIDLDLKVVASKLDGNELLTAYSVGSKYQPDSNVNRMQDNEYEKMVENTADEIRVEEGSGSSLFVVPANVRAKINLEGYDVSYANMNIDWLNCDITMKERCIQIANTVAAANLGNLFFEGFYSTRTKKDITAGFNLSLMDITAAEVIEMIPQVDSLVPMLKSFDGLLDCEFAGTTALDTAMNFIMPSVNGVMRISGKNLTLEQDEDLRKITRLLKFRNRKEFRINNMSVEGLIKDNKIEIFPFLLDLDRYRVAMSGVQNLDMSFRYHVSVIRSPLVFKFGVDLYGKDFDHLKFKIGRAKYRNAKSVPAFSATIDQTKMNLSESIKSIFERGVERAVAENEKQSAIEARKEELSYVPSVDQPLEELSAEEQQKMAEEDKILDNPESEDVDNQDVEAAEETGTDNEKNTDTAPETEE